MKPFREAAQVAYVFALPLGMWAWASALLYGILSKADRWWRSRQK